MVIHKGLNMMTCGGNNCYVVRGAKGDILIDTGAAADRFEIEAWLRGFDIGLIILTHGHNDHIGISHAHSFREAVGEASPT